MYELYTLTNNDWIFYNSYKDIQNLDKDIYQLTLEHYVLEIIKDDIELCYINGIMYQYHYFKNKYVKNKEVNYDYVKSYKKEGN